MFFAIQETPYDLKWRMFGIHVRVHPLFWLISGILAWDYIGRFGIPAFLIAVACIFVSILIHELGHVVMGNFFGSHGHTIGGHLSAGSPLHLPSGTIRFLLLAATIGVPLAPRVVPFTALTEIERAARRAVDEIDFDSHADRLVHEACVCRFLHPINAGSGSSICSIPSPGR